MPDLTNNPGSEDHTETVISILGHSARPLSTMHRANIAIPVVKAGALVFNCLQDLDSV